ncbi:GNAT family N-acetyltransferase [Oceanobacillus profundus]|uniref:N-acetyltransferase n=1 Tax=Oceanobacillus profundus TaxID=372463 RepID=A0A417Y8Y2_9BACI|nr:GNAT family N-acetyltransferase [Oceanobacillus profundus]RHW29210.1 N-acetyltransferase [Oceanobacillus profundus]
MTTLFLVQHQKKYAEEISRLSSAVQVKEALGLDDEQTSIEGTINFITHVFEQERLGKQFSRVILNDGGELIGVITLKDIDRIHNRCHIGTWIGYPYWGKGYNAMAKTEILHIAFSKFRLKNVFAGAKRENIRSQKAQEKLPYIRIGVEKEFPEEHRKLESQAEAPCILNVIERQRCSWRGIEVQYEFSKRSI